MTNDVLENARSHFENLVTEQLERVEKMKEAQDWIDYSSLEPIISVRDTTYFAAAKRFVQAQAFVAAGEYAQASDGYLDLVRDMPSRYSFSSLSLLRAGETFEAAGRRYYAMSLYRLWAETFGLMDEEAAAEVSARADRIAADYRDPLKTVAEKMAKVGGMLGASDSGEANQRTQQEIIEQLDDLIALLEEQQDETETSTASGDSEQPTDVSATPAPAPAPAAAPTATDGVTAPSDPSDSWGLLPPAEREKLLKTFAENMPERYRRIIRDYFARLARTPSR